MRTYTIYRSANDAGGGENFNQGNVDLDEADGNAAVIAELRARADAEFADPEKGLAAPCYAAWTAEYIGDWMTHVVVIPQDQPGILVEE